MHEEGLFVPLYVGWLDNRKVVQSGPAERGLHATALCFAKRLAESTDGWIHRSLLRREGFDDTLIDRGVALDLLDADGESVRPHGWHRRNPSQDAISASRASKSEAGKRGNHKRHGHPGDYETCPTCHPAPQTPRSSQGATGVRGPAIAPDRTLSPETETETETSLLSSQSDFTTEPAHADEEEDDDGWGPMPTDADPDRWTRANQICERIGTNAHDRRMATGGVTHPHRHRDACIAGARRDHLTDLQRLIHDNPNWTDDDLIAHITRPPIERTTVPANQSRHPALLAQTATTDDDSPPSTAEFVAQAAAKARAALRQQPTGDTAA